MRLFLFFFRLPLLVFLCVGYFAILQWLPIGSLGKKASLWCILGVPSIWWIDLQVDGVRKGYVYSGFNGWQGRGKKRTCGMLMVGVEGLLRNSKKRVCRVRGLLSHRRLHPLSTLYT